MPKNIARIDIYRTEAYPNRRETHGWQVRMMREGKRRTKFFSDSRHGSPAAALLAARAYRDRLEEELPPPLSPGEAALRAIQARSTTNTPGIRFVMKADKKGFVYPTILASWSYVDGTGRRVRRTRSLSVHRRSLEKALWKACAWLVRKRGLGAEAAMRMYRRAYPKIKQQYEQARQEVS